MKLKKAMKLYPIEVLEGDRTHYKKYKLGIKTIWESEVYGWVGDNVPIGTEKEAVAWLIEGAETNREQKIQEFFEGITGFHNTPEHPEVWIAERDPNKPPIKVILL